jgi:hypothetical protein
VTDMAEETIPLAPGDPIALARAYATLAFNVNQQLNVRLRDLEKEVDETKGVALAAHGLATEIRARLEDVAITVKARAGATRSVPPPPPTEKLEINFSPSDTGTHVQLTNAEIRRLQAKFTEKEAEERGAKAALQEKLDNEELDRKRAKAQREKWIFIAVILSTIGGAIVYAVDHFAWVKP